MIIHPNESKNQAEVKRFEKTHVGHTLVTLELTEVEDQYSSIPLTS